MATRLLHNFRTMGGATAGALAAFVLSAGHDIPSVTGYTALWAIIAASCFAAAATAALAQRDS
ncbi:hypothetical protein [Streptomyces sp. PSKA30]|uniref:hypothetical protein n=1 Tax=Streptomyces sp. PSKA30 TaxID=2874597 RepID=UPI001CD0E2C3|nr:hypothetical protein [Streptomyces sp. PSKA30]MBZ9644320.1 hypothetical protein [Streptomyces sp. PSKA30]